MDTDDELDECEQPAAERLKAVHQQYRREIVENHIMLPSMTKSSTSIFEYMPLPDSPNKSTTEADITEPTDVPENSIAVASSNVEKTQSKSRAILAAHMRAVMTFFEPHADFETVQALVMEDEDVFPSQISPRIEELFWEPGSSWKQTESTILAPFTPPVKPVMYRWRAKKPGKTKSELVVITVKNN